MALQQVSFLFTLLFCICSATFGSWPIKTTYHCSKNVYQNEFRFRNSHFLSITILVIILARTFLSWLVLWHVVFNCITS